MAVGQHLSTLGRVKVAGSYTHLDREFVLPSPCRLVLRRGLALRVVLSDASEVCPYA